MSSSRDFHKSSRPSFQVVQRLRMLPSRLYTTWNQGFVRKVREISLYADVTSGF